MRDLCKFSAKFKSHVALEAIREQKTLAELSKEYEVSVNQISLWKQEAIKNMEALFGGERSQREVKEMGEQIKNLQAKVGELTMERDFWINFSRSAKASKLAFALAQSKFSRKPARG